MKVSLVEITAYDPVLAATVVMNLANTSDARACSLNGVAWVPVIARAPRRTLDLFDGGFTGEVTTGFGDLELSVAGLRKFWPNVARYVFAGRRVRTWRGVLGAAWGSYALTFDGLAQAPKLSAQRRLTVPLTVDDAWLDRPLPAATYAGTGGIEGAAALKGTTKPLCLGAPRFVEGVQVDAVNSVWQVSAYGAIHGIAAAFDRLSAYPAPVADYATYALLVAASLTRGQWATCLASGLARFGAPPAGPVSFHVEGDTVAGWVQKPGAVIGRLATLAGATGGQIDSASLAALDTALPYNMSIVIDTPTTARALIQQIAASCNATAGISWLGKLFVARVGIGSPALMLRTDGTALPPVKQIELLESGAPWWRLQMQAAKTWRVHSSGEYGTFDAASVVYADGTVGEDLQAPSLEVPPAITVKADYTGVVLSGQLPRAVKGTRRKGTTDVSSSTTWTATSFSGCTASIASDGTVTITACTTSGKINWSSTRDGVVREAVTTVIKDLAAAPAPTGGGGGTGGGSSGSGSPAYDSSISDTTGTSYGSANSDVLEVTAGSSGQVDLTAPLTYSRVGSGTVTQMRGKWQWRAVGGTFADVASEISQISVFVAGEPDSGYIEVSQSKTGLTSGTPYQFQLLLRNNTGSGTLASSGTATATPT